MDDQRTDAAGTIVVGFDGSPHGEAALRYALAEGARRGMPVNVVTASEPPESWAYAYSVYPLLDSGEAREAMQAASTRRVEEIRDGLDDAQRAVPVEVTTIVGPPSVVLTESAKGAALLVVGHRGRGGLRSALLGSAGLSAVLHAPCPVTVVPAYTVAEEQIARAVDAAAVAP